MDDECFDEAERTLGIVRDLAEHKRRFSPDRRYARRARRWPAGTRLQPNVVNLAEREALERSVVLHKQWHVQDRGALVSGGNAWATSAERF